MVSLEATSRSIDASPRISFSSEFLDEKNFISISPTQKHHDQENGSNSNKQKEKEKPTTRNVDFEFLLSSNVSSDSLLTADELFFEGKLLPFWQMQQSEKLKKISLKPKDEANIGTNNGVISRRKEDITTTESSSGRAVNWFVDDDPSPRPPKCTVLWKELLKLKKQRASSSLSQSLPSNSNSSSEQDHNNVKRVKKGLERTRSASIRIRPMINLPICTSQVKSSTTSSLPPLFPIKKQTRF